jgi:cytochrome c oxidase subunit 2
MISQDVIHGFYIPAFRIKRDAIPGRYNTVSFTATRPGKYHLFCTEYCGTNHSEMGGWVYVMTPADYATWLKTGGQGAIPAKSPTLEEQGRTLFTDLACANCHGPQDSVRAPTLVGIYNRPRKLLSGEIVTADDAYLRGAIRKPEDHLLDGYGQVTTMPAYGDTQLSEEQVHDLIVYIKSLGSAQGKTVATKPASHTDLAPAGGMAPSTGGTPILPNGTTTSPGGTEAPTSGGTPPPAKPGQPSAAVKLKSGAQTASAPSAPTRNTGSTL